MENSKLIIKCPKCRTNKEIIASETIEATTDFAFKDGVCVDTNNEYGNGISVDFRCMKCGHVWRGRKGITINSYLKDEEDA